MYIILKSDVKKAYVRIRYLFIYIYMCVCMGVYVYVNVSTCVRECVMVFVCANFILYANRCEFHILYKQVH